MQTELEDSREEATIGPDESHRHFLELEVLCETAPVAMGLLDKELRYVRLNEALAQINGLAVADHLGRPASEVNPPLAEIVVPMMQEVLASGQPLLNVEVTANSAGAINQRSWMLNLHPVSNLDGRGVSVFFQDITPHKKALDALRRSNEELRQFAFAAAHDLQEPIRNIGVCAQMCKYNLDTEPVDQLTVIIESAQRMQALIKGLLAFARAVDEVHPDQYQAVDCNEVCLAALANLASAVKESGASVTIGRLPAIFASGTHVLQVFQNLIDNALKYRSRERLPEIRISAEWREDYWDFSVQDNGLGIAPEYHERIFGVFKRLHGRDIPGAGIGLSICKRIVCHYGGQLWLESEPGVGTTFHFAFPNLPRFE